MYAFIGLAMSMYSSSQGAAKVIGPVLAQSARLVFIGLGGWWLSTHDATAANFFALAAASMVVLGVLSASSVILTRWAPKRRGAPQARPALSCAKAAKARLDCFVAYAPRYDERVRLSAAGDAGGHGRRRDWPTASTAESCSSSRSHRRHRACSRNRRRRSRRSRREFRRRQAFRQNRRHRH